MCFSEAAPHLPPAGRKAWGWPGRRQCGALGWPRRQERRTTYRAVTKKKALKTAVQAVNANMAAATANPDEAGLRHDVEAATETLTSNKQRHARWAWKRGSRKRGSRAQKASDTEGTTRVMANCPERRETEGWRVKSCTSIGTGVPKQFDLYNYWRLHSPAQATSWRVSGRPAAAADRRPSAGCTTRFSQDRHKRGGVGTTRSRAA